MSQLVVIHDTFTGTREHIDLYCGESLASNFRRLWPNGIRGPWRVYRGVAHADNEIAAMELPGVVVAPFQVYVLVRGVGAAAVPFFINLAIAIGLKIIASFFTPKRRQAEEIEAERSPNNALAGQSNQLRAGSRIPQLLGKVRAYPDLLCAPIETWFERQQQIVQWFVLGMGDYAVTDARLGDTPVSSITGSSAIPFPPGDPDDTLTWVPEIQSVRECAEVQSISLDTQDTTAAPVTGVTWTAPATLTLDTYLSVTVGQFISVSGTLSNSKIFQVTAVPPSGTSAPPYVYTLSGPAVVNESGGGAAIIVMTQVGAANWQVSPPYGETYPNNEMAVIVNSGGLPAVGQVLFLNSLPFTGGTMQWTGVVTSLENRAYDPPPAGPPIFHHWVFEMNTLAGVPISFTNPGSSPPGILQAIWYAAVDDPVDTGGGSGTPGDDTGQWTNWYTVPHNPPDSVWIDLEFPQGLLRYHNGVREGHSVNIAFEFRRHDVPATVITKSVSRGGNTSGPLRWTEKYPVSDLTASGLPAGGRIEVRVRRTSAIPPDTTAYQYVQDSVWRRLAGMKILPSRCYTEVTVVGLSLTNSRSATSMGQGNFNCLAESKLPSWDGSAWTAPAATEKWADAFVARCKSTDGANKTDAQIDLAGIYALQAQLDDMDPSAPGADDGDQGKISITLDQSQDIDSELTQLADIVRAQVYRVGKKIFVTRDQSTATRLALFNGRTKDPDGEGVQMRMTNEGENDGVTVTWLDQGNEFKIREYTYTTKPQCVNPARIAAFCANWAQAYRRAVFEWNRLRYRREQISVNVTEDGRICRPGDVVNITDDIANLAATAGEVLRVSGWTLTLDRDVEFIAGHTYSLLVRDVLGQATDIIPVLVVVGLADHVVLTRDPVAGVTIKGRDTAMGTLYAFYDDTAAIVRPWLLTGVSVSGPYVQLQGVNYTDLAFSGDSGSVPPKPALTPDALAMPPGF